MSVMRGQHCTVADFVIDAHERGETIDSISKAHGYKRAMVAATIQRYEAAKGGLDAHTPADEVNYADFMEGDE